VQGAPLANVRAFLYIFVEVSWHNLEISTFVLAFPQTLFMNKLEFYSFIDSFVWIYETLGMGMVLFSAKCSFFRCISNCGFYV
jgi:hypothetical protein